MKTVSAVCDIVKVPTTIGQNSPSRRGNLPHTKAGYLEPLLIIYHPLFRTTKIKDDRGCSARGFFADAFCEAPVPLKPAPYKPKILKWLAED